MGNKDLGRSVANQPFIEYMNDMGAVSPNKNDGVFSPGMGVSMYLDILRDYYLNRFVWESNKIDEDEFRTAESIIFDRGYCVLLKPVLKTATGFLKSPKIKAFFCSYLSNNVYNGIPDKISVYTDNLKNVDMVYEYGKEDFVILSDSFDRYNTHVPFKYIALEYANKLLNVDLAFEANINKLRMPMVFNNGNMKDKNDKLLPRANTIGLAEIFRGAFGRRELFVEVPEKMVGVNGFMHEAKNVNSEILNYVEAQNKLYNSFLELLGVKTVKEKKGVYTGAIQDTGEDETEDYVTTVRLNNRLYGARQLAKKFDCDVSIREVV